MNMRDVLVMKGPFQDESADVLESHGVATDHLCHEQDLRLQDPSSSKGRRIGSDDVTVTGKQEHRARHHEKKGRR